MTLKTTDGIEFYCLPSSALCLIVNRNPEIMTECPLRKFDRYGMVCVPDECEHYEE